MHPTEDIKVIISGLTAAGKTTHSRLCSKQFRLHYVSGSSVLLKNVISEREPRPRDFWISDESFALDSERMKNPVKDLVTDQHLVKILEKSDGDFVFDTWILPWLSSTRSLKIWLESSLDSRALKAMVSHEGTSRFSLREVRERLAKRDQRTNEFFLKYYNVNVLKERSPFDVILEVSRFIKEPTQESSVQSIAAVQDMISNIVAWYIDPTTERKTNVIDCLNRYPSDVFIRLPTEIVG